MKPTQSLASFCLASLLATSGSAHADNPAFAPGDLVLHAQQEGNSKRVYAKLGSAALTFRGAATGADVPNMLNIANINAEMISAFGDNWATLDNVFIGLAAAFTNQDAPVVENGDPWRTSYVSSSRNAIGTIGLASSTPRNLSGNTAMTTLSGAILSMLLSDFDNSGADAVEMINVQPNKLVENHPFILGGAQGTAYASFGSGVQQKGSASPFGVFGGAGEVEFAIDLYRLYGNTNGSLSGAVPGTRGQGTFEGTVTVDALGNVSFITQGSASSPYATWIATFPTITTPADKLETADPDGDGATNLEEFGFGGNPANGSDSGIGQVQTVDANSDALNDITLTLEVRSGATFSPSGNDLVSAAVDEVTYRIEGSADLVNWDSAVSEVTPALGSGSPSTGYVFKTFRLNAGNGLTGKGFLRAVVTK